MNQRRAPETAAGYSVLHDFRTVDWARWNRLSAAEQEDILAEAGEFFDREISEDGDLGCFSVLGHKADLLVLTFRPSMGELDTFQRRFQQLELAKVAERATSAVGVTEASGYTEAAADFFDPDAEADPGIERYMQARLHPDIPDVEFVSFYFMNKRRDPEYNWYDLPYEERAEHVSRHGEIGKEYAGKVTQIITATTGLDDWEWGVTLFAEDPVAIKDLLTDMRFDPSTSHFAEFGQFYVGRRFPPADLGAFLAGDPIPTEDETDEPAALGDELAALGVEPDPPADAHAVIVRHDAEAGEVQTALDGLRGNFEHYDSHVQTTLEGDDDGPVVVSIWETARAAETAAGFLEELPGAGQSDTGPVASPAPEPANTGDAAAEEVRSALEAAGVYAGRPHGEDLHAVVLYSTADEADLRAEVEELSDGFDRYDSHEGTTAYVSTERERAAIVSLWESVDAAETAAEHLQGLPEIERPEEEVAGFTTMGMFYRVQQEHREDFLETFAGVGDALAGMDGHLETDLLVNVADEHDMFIASRWRAKEDAMTFFRSDAFRETVQFGREILADRPRHVFLV